MTAANGAAAAAAGAPPPTLTFHDKAAPLGPLLIAALGGVALDAKADPAAAKGSDPVLKLDGGCVVVFFFSLRWPSIVSAGAF
jgi:hypothetical protein